MPPRPRKKLDSKRIEDSLRANILPLVSLLSKINSLYSGPVVNLACHAAEFTAIHAVNY